LFDSRRRALLWAMTKKVFNRADCLGIYNMNPMIDDDGAVVDDYGVINGKTVLVKNLSHSHIVYHKSHMN
jgi:hypothetical protein